MQWRPQANPSPSEAEFGILPNSIRRSRFASVVVDAHHTTAPAARIRDEEMIMPAWTEGNWLGEWHDLHTPDIEGLPGWVWLSTGGDPSLFPRHEIEPFLRVTAPSRWWWMPVDPPPPPPLNPTHTGDRLREALVEFTGVISRIDYICGEPNDMECSAFDVHADPNAVLDHVQRELEARYRRGFEDGRKAGLT